MRAHLLVLAGLAAGAASAADGPAVFNCRAQVIYDCSSDCEQNTMPADLRLDFATKQGTFCRGSGCVEGSLVMSEAKGQWDDAPYRIFKLQFKDAGNEPVSGVLHGGVFHADGLGSMAGTCEAEGG